jgi:hypothetical protein
LGIYKGILSTLPDLNRIDCFTIGDGYRKNICLVHLFNIKCKIKYEV